MRDLLIFFQDIALCVMIAMMLVTSGKDPDRWPRWRKVAAAITIIFTAVLTLVVLFITIRVDA